MSNGSVARHVDACAALARGAGAPPWRPRGLTAPAAPASSSSRGSSADRSNPTGESSSAPDPPYVSRKLASAGGHDAHGRHGAGDARKVALGMPSERSAATAAGDANTPHARQRQRGARSRTMTSRPARASSIAVSAPGGTTADDRDVDRFGRHPLAAPGAVRRHGGDRPAMPREPASLRDRAKPGLVEQARASPLGCTRGGPRAAHRGA